MSGHVIITALFYRDTLHLCNTVNVTDESELICKDEASGNFMLERIHLQKSVEFVIMSWCWVGGCQQSRALCCALLPSDISSVQKKFWTLDVVFAAVT